jgi:hypothetical protein
MNQEHTSWQFAAQVADGREPDFDKTVQAEDSLADSSGAFVDTVCQFRPAAAAIS